MSIWVKSSRGICWVMPAEEAAGLNDSTLFLKAYLFSEWTRIGLYSPPMGFLLLNQHAYGSKIVQYIIQVSPIRGDYISKLEQLNAI